MLNLGLVSGYLTVELYIAIMWKLLMLHWKHFPAHWQLSAKFWHHVERDLNRETPARDLESNRKDRYLMSSTPRLAMSENSGGPCQNVVE